jgi:hypothetical protein
LKFEVEKQPTTVQQQAQASESEIKQFKRQHTSSKRLTAHLPLSINQQYIVSQALQQESGFIDKEQSI